MKKSEWSFIKDKNGKILTMKLKPKIYAEAMWFLDIFKSYTNEGYVLTKETARSLEDFADCNIDTLYWFSSVCHTNKNLANEAIKWMIGPIKEILNEHGETFPSIKIKPIVLEKIIDKIDKKLITPTMGKDIIKRVFYGEDIDIILDDDKYKITTDNEIEIIINKIIEDNPIEAADYKSGNPKALNWFIGQVMKATKGKANAATVSPLLKEKLA